MGALDWKDFGVVILRGVALTMDLTGRMHAASTLFKLADKIEAGENVDTYMGEVSRLLKERTIRMEDWVELYDKIHAADARLDSDEPAPENT